MVKNSTPARFRPVKAPIGSKKPASEKKRHAKPLTVAKRRNKFYGEGKGTTGLLVSRPRIRRVIRAARLRQMERIESITGIPSKTKRPAVSKGFIDVTTGAVDAYANRVMHLAAQFAKARRTGWQKNRGMALRREDLIRARNAIRVITHE